MERAVTHPSSTRAVGIPEFGGPEVLRIIERPMPEPGAGEIRIKVAAAAVNPTDTVLRAGLHANRLGSLRPPYVPGMELAGTVDAVGDAGWQVGERVMAIVAPLTERGGAQAEFVVVPGASVARVPDGTGLAEAATLPMNGLTVRRTLDVLALEPGETLAITGAAGAVGGYAIQLARTEGLRVIADAKPADDELVRELGADVVVPRGPEVATDIRRNAPDGVAAVLDAALIGRPLLPAIRDGGQLAAVRPFDGESERRITVTLIQVVDYVRAGDKLARLADLVAEGKLTLRVADTLPAEQAAEAHRRLEAGGTRGRLVLTF
ncbi:MAG: zinc-binding dehydrogenase [Pseudonocardiaceae bacterium]|nr:zinc-binding dehydrogenase [Pseudonocardiaceae bacterium]